MHPNNKSKQCPGDMNIKLVFIYQINKVTSSNELLDNRKHFASKNKKG